MLCWLVGLLVSCLVRSFVRCRDGLAVLVAAAVDLAFGYGRAEIVIEFCCDFFFCKVLRWN